jgi:hypothetical protein
VRKGRGGEERGATGRGGDRGTRERREREGERSKTMEELDELDQTILGPALKVNFTINLEYSTLKLVVHPNFCCTFSAFRKHELNCRRISVKIIFSSYLWISEDI